MKISWKDYLRPWLPPALVTLIRASPRQAFDFRGNFEGWDEARRAATGYDAAPIFEKVVAATRAVERGDAAYERDAVLFKKPSPSWPVLAGLLMAASQCNGSLRVLDFGGSLGTMYRQNRALLELLHEIRWGVVEQAHFVTAGRAEFTTSALTFHSTIQECVDSISPNAITLGAALQYMPSPTRLITELGAAGARTMIIDRTPFSTEAIHRLTVQHVREPIYRASYPSWIFSTEQFKRDMSEEWSISAWYDCDDGSHRTDAGVEFKYRGAILVR